MSWTRSDLSTVAMVTLGNGLWLGFIFWLVLGVWLEMVGFIPCWLGATFLSWIIAIKRQYRVMEIRAKMNEEMRGD